MVDWSLSGVMQALHERPSLVQGHATFSNFGDGIAHRVVVRIHRGDAPEHEVIAFSPLMQPGDTLDFKVDCVLDDWETAVVWVTWTAPPIRRRRERTSQKFLIAKHLNLSDAMRERMKKLKEHESDGG